MNNLSSQRHGRSQVFHDPGLAAAPQPEHFQPAHWQQQDLVTGSGGGRNLAYFIDAANGLTQPPLPLVLRHYYRGGLLGRFNRDYFLRLPGQRCRALNEFNLLQWMRGQSLPVPRPVAARCSGGLCYRADILIERLPCDGDLFGRLKAGPLSQTAWQAVGALVRKFHQAQVFHSDLNCHNILIAESSAEKPPQLWLIDFDKCQRRRGEGWKQDNLARLQRSLVKEQGLHTPFYFTPADWQSLLQGYAGEANA
jgi:tRNA A-37 threonylcarbamoyl transferase component Bud32